MRNHKLKNKDKALKILRARLYDLEQQKQHDEMAELRKSQVERETAPRRSVRTTSRRDV